MHFARYLFLISVTFFKLLAAQADAPMNGFPYLTQSKFFSLHYQRDSWDAAGFARLADGFVELVNRDFLEMPFSYPIKVLVLADRASFKTYLRKQLHIIDPPSFGIYIFAEKLFVTFEDAGIGTFAHEIMHPLIERNLFNCPVWATEAIPAFFEKGFGYWDRDDLVMQWGYQNPWRIQALASGLESLDLAHILADQRPITDSANSDRRLVSVFLWQHGKFRVFLRLIKDQNYLGYGSYFEAAMGKPLREIEPMWKEYLADIASHRTEISRIPASAVFSDRASYAKALSELYLWRILPISSELDAKRFISE